MEIYLHKKKNLVGRCDVVEASVSKNIFDSKTKEKF